MEVPTLTPTVGLTFMELQPVKARAQTSTIRNLFIQQALSFRLIE